MLTLERPAPPARTDAIVVLTGGAGRIARGLQLMEDGHGEAHADLGRRFERAPGELAAEYSVPRRLFACCIDLGYEAVDTRSNAEETARWLTHPPLYDRCGWSPPNGTCTARGWNWRAC